MSKPNQTWIFLKSVDYDKSGSKYYYCANSSRPVEGVADFFLLSPIHLVCIFISNFYK